MHTGDMCYASPRLTKRASLMGPSCRAPCDDSVLDSILKRLPLFSPAWKAHFNNGHPRLRPVPHI
eukprot:9271447-Alexandrium_andersonii.AAC.1